MRTFSYILSCKYHLLLKTVERGDFSKLHPSFGFTYLPSETIVILYINPLNKLCRFDPKPLRFHCSFGMLSEFMKNCIASLITCY